jgi:nicotinate-nucleotide pyrophosphorylase (carboxylating)
MDRFYTHPIDRISPSDFRPLLALAILEDCPDHDITSESIFSETDTAKANLITHEEGIFVGGEIFVALQEFFPETFTFQLFKEEGGKLQKGDLIATISGNLRIILQIERILLNFLQYLSGIASNVNRLAIQYPNLLILDTRKTLPGYRKLVKYAVYMGGGANHRIHLSDMGLIKDNHVAMSGSIQSAVRSIRKKFPDRKVELEIDGLFQLDDALDAEPDMILLDNFSLEDTIVAVEKIRRLKPSIRIECSGGITPEKLKSLSELGEIGVSMGYLTHTTRFMDLSLEIERV